MPRRTSIIGLTAMLAAIAGVPGADSQCTKFQGNASTNPTGPILDLVAGDYSGDFADPRCMYHDGVYYAYGTNNYNANRTNVPVATSMQFNKGWSFVDYHDTLPNAGAWTAKDENGDANVWDPSVFYVGGQFVMYYAANTPTSSGNGTAHCTGAAVADNPLGPFKAQDEPLFCPDPVVKVPYISPELVRHNGSNYIIIKYGNGSNNGTDPNGHSHLQLVNMSSDGLTVTSAPVSLYESTKADWDAEGPNIIYNDGVFFLLYVIRNYETPAYAIHYVTSTDGIYGPYKTPGKVFLETGIVGPDNVYVLSPGGPSFFNATHMMIMTTVPQAADCTRGSTDIRGPSVAVVKYNGETISLA